MAKTNRVDKATIVRLFKSERDFVAGIISIATCAGPASSTLPDQDDDLVYISEKKPSKEEARKIQRAKSYQELNERLNKLKGTKDFSIKTKLMKKSLARKIKKQNKKNERRTKNKTIRIERTKPNEDAPEIKEEKIKIPKVATKPVFNSQGKMVFSKFDFSESGIPEDKRKGEKNPKKILETLKKHKETLKELNVAGEKEKAAHLMEKTAWKNALAKAEGQKIKDDPILLKKSASKLDQKKKQSAKKWEQRIQGVEKSKSDKQKRRETNISKRNQDKKKKVMKKAVKKGRMLQ